MFAVLAGSEEGARCRICHAVADPFGDHQVGCGGMGIGFIGMILSEMQFFQQPNQLL